MSTVAETLPNGQTDMLVSSKGLGVMVVLVALQVVLQLASVHDSVHSGPCSWASTAGVVNKLKT